MQVILSGHTVRADLEATPIGAFDVIRDDVRMISTVKPVERIFIERTETGYRGVLYSNEKPFLFALNGNGFTAKPIAQDATVFAYCDRLQDEERDLTMRLDQERADADMVDVNRVMFERDSNLTDDAAVAREDASPATLKVWGPSVDIADPIERVPGAYRKMRQGGSSLEGKRNNGVCGGGIVMKDGKVLLVKPRGGWGGYDWTFPKGYPAAIDNNHLEQTAVREVCEETGYRVFANRFIGRFSHNDGGVCDYFYCDVDNSKEAGTPDPHETSAIKWCSLVEALELLNDDVDVKILAQANNLLPQLIIKSEGHTGTMVALHLPTDIAKKIALKGGEDPAKLHITLAYLGKGLSEQQKKTAASVVRRFAESIVDGLKVTLGGVGRFSASGTTEGRDVIYLSVDSPSLTRVRPELANMLREAGFDFDVQHGFIPHVTLAYVDKDEKTPINRVEPIEIKFDTISLTIANKQMTFPLKLSKQNQEFYDVGRRNYEALMKWRVDKLEKMYGVRLPIKPQESATFVRLDKSLDYEPVMVKALPRMNSDQRDAKNKKVGVKPPGAAKKQAGATGKTRYTYPAEQANAKPGQPQQPGGQPQQPGAPGQPQQGQDQVLPHPDTPPPQPEQAPIAAEHPDKPPQNDPRGPNPQEPQQPKHTINIGELCAALGVQRSVLQQIVARMQKNFGADARKKFVSFMSVQLKQFADEHGLEGDYFGLLFDVLTGKVQEGQPASQQQPQPQGGSRGAKA